MAYIVAQKQQCVLMPHTLTGLPYTTSLKVAGDSVALTCSLGM